VHDGDVWGDEIRPVPEKFIGPDLSEATREFLRDVGLPTGTHWGITFHHDERLTTPLERGDRRYVAIGHHDDGFLYVVDTADDRLYELHPDRDEPTHFVTSTLAAFVNFLGVFCSRLPILAETNQEDAAVIVREMRETFAARDPRAVSDDTTWWSVVLYETEMGYF
jgi:hypothetical protein